jgi:hypothetical protein
VYDKEYTLRQNLRRSKAATKGADARLQGTIQRVIPIKTRTLDDGSVVAMHQDAKLARESHGRIYRQHVTRLPANPGEKSSVYEIMLTDPAAHTRTTCVIAARQSSLKDFRGPTSPRPQTVTAFDDGNAAARSEVWGMPRSKGWTSLAASRCRARRIFVRSRSHLSVTRKDPRLGTLLIHVVNVSRSEPEPSLFQIPANFLVQDLRRTAKSEN